MTKPLDESLYDQLVSIRRYLHANPELSGKEYETVEYVKNTLADKFPPSFFVEGLGGTGLAATYDSGTDGPTLLFRAELDALPIEEVNNFDYQSNRSGVSHKCGHDGHMTILIGLAAWLTQNPPVKGKVVLLFQPAEENGSGAVSVLEDEDFEGIDPDCVYAFHNLPGHPKGSIIVKEGPFTSAVNSLLLTFRGKTSHAGEPQSGVNPALVMAKVIAYADEMNQFDRSRKDFCILTPVYATLGEKAYGVSAGHGELHFTLRTRNEDVMAEKEDKLLSEIYRLANDSDLKLEVDYTDRFYGNSNDQEAVDHIKEVAKAKAYDLIELEDPLPFGEDFGAFTQQFSGAMFCIGSGENTPALHNPDYDFPEELIDYGVQMFSGLTQFYTHTND